jgi:NAD(P)-dependent dehydrogenase (short-subunit alcohol dehydrogenase family)
MSETIIEQPKKQHVLVTGGTRNLGRAISLALVEAGHRVSINYKSNHESAQQTLEEAKALAEVSGGDALLAQADMSNPYEFPSLLERCNEKFGEFDSLILNAFGPSPKRYGDFTIEEAIAMAMTNVVGPDILCEMMLKRYLKKPEIDGIRGKYIFSNSIRGVNYGSLAKYGGSFRYRIHKAAENELALDLSIRGRKDGILAWSVILGFLEETMNKLPQEQVQENMSQTLSGRPIAFRDVANLYVDLVGRGIDPWSDPKDPFIHFNDYIGRSDEVLPEVKDIWGYI